MSIRFGGSKWLRYPIRIVLAAAVIAAGFLPYDFEICGHCRVIPNHEIGLRAQLSDEIAAVHVADGQVIEAGTVVVTLVGREADADLAKAKADVDYANAFLKQMETGYRPEDIAAAASKAESLTSQLVFAELQVDRNSNLLGKSAVAQSAYEKSISARDALKSDLIAAKEILGKLQSGYRQEGIDEARAKLAKCEAEMKLQQQKSALKEIRSPIRGTVCKPAIEAIAGQVVMAGDLIAVVQDRHKLSVQVLADESAAYYVKEGMPVQLRLWGNYGALVTGYVQRTVAIALDEGKFAAEGFRSDRESLMMQQRYPDNHWRYVSVIVSLADSSVAEPILPGMSGEARIAVAKDCFWGALLRDMQRLVFVEIWSWLP